MRRLWTTADHVWIRWSVADLRADIVRPDFLFIEPDGAGYPTYTVSVWNYVDHPYVQITGADDSVSLRCRTNGSVKVDYARNYVQAVFSKGCFVRGHRINTPYFMSILRSRDNQVQLNDVTRAVPGFVPNP